MSTSIRTTAASPPCQHGFSDRQLNHGRSVVVDTSREERRVRGTAYVLLMRLNNERLPRALELKAIVDRGQRLTDYDTLYLKRVISEANAVSRAANKLPEYRTLVTQMASLYDEITRKALVNEQKPESKPKPRKLWPD